MANDSSLKPISTLVLDEPGMMRTSLRALLATVPNLQLCPAADLATASQELVHDLHPDCVLIVCDLGNHGLPLPGFVADLKTTWPDIRCVVITISSERNQEYLAAGADVGLVAGFTQRDLCQAIHSRFNLNASRELS
jgi:DNA-binding NarL/FixJ family response regulator